MSLFWRRRRREAELDEEIRGHLAMAARDHEARGESLTEAAYAARREFGNATLVKEVTRQMWAGAWLDGLAQDLRLALRSLRRTPAFTLTVVTLLGLGFGGAAGMYGILDRLLLRAPEHVSDPDGLYAPYITASDLRGAEVTSGTMQWRDYRLLTDGVEAVSAAAAFTEPEREPVTVGTAQVEAQSVMASAGYFDVLGVRPAVGRFFLPEDSAGSAPPGAVVGHGFGSVSSAARRTCSARRLLRGASSTPSSGWHREASPGPPRSVWTCGFPLSMLPGPRLAPTGKSTISTGRWSHARGRVAALPKPQRRASSGSVPPHWIPATGSVGSTRLSTPARSCQAECLVPRRDSGSPTSSAGRLPW